MAEILETVMLVCFGLSWPVNLIKSIKAKTAKSTSIKFLLLILLGYIAGISAKFAGGNINYVVIVYVINIIFVSLNVIVYFINAKYDRQSLTQDSINDNIKA